MLLSLITKLAFLSLASLGSAAKTEDCPYCPPAFSLFVNDKEDNGLDGLVIAANSLTFWIGRPTTCYVRDGEDDIKRCPKGAITVFNHGEGLKLMRLSSASLSTR